MNQKLLLTLTLLGILTLAFISQNKPLQIGTIESIQTTKYKTTIHIQNFTPELILFDPYLLTLQKGDKIKFQGRPDTYKNKEQIIVSKIIPIHQ